MASECVDSSETVATILGAFTAALQAMPPVRKTQTATVDTRTGGSYSYQYADLGSVIAAARPVLTEQGLAVSQVAHDDGSITTMLWHSSGEWLAFGPLSIRTGQSSPQATGSAISFARRYALVALLGIATEDDDDATAAERLYEPEPTHSPPASARPTRGPTPAQTRRAMAMFKAAGLGDRDDRLAFASNVIGRDIESWNDVTGAEAAAVMDALPDNNDEYQEDEHHE